MASEGAKKYKLDIRVRELQLARESGDPKAIKKSLEYFIGVAKTFYDVDQLTNWLDLLFTEIDPREEISKALREPYVQAGKIHYEPPEDRLPNRLKFKDQNNGNVRLV